MFFGKNCKLSPPFIVVANKTSPPKKNKLWSNKASSKTVYIVQKTGRFCKFSLCLPSRKNGSIDFLFQKKVKVQLGMHLKVETVHFNKYWSTFTTKGKFASFWFFKTQIVWVTQILRNVNSQQSWTKTLVSFLHD